ncbi:uncharacterized protein LOC131944305 [Physella acuta]|uniref:uncharacterized protein LOC131944305 n=1 Tax=Physella acuta TaxID=109671 RepID=UPI0027DE8706|nr:uncharacterized protein LOC131944305 [Physella acuta]
MTQQSRNESIQLFTKLLKLYSSIINKLNDEQGLVLEDFHKYEGAGSQWFDSIKSSEAAKYLNSKCHSENKVTSAFKEVTGTLKMIEFIKLASLVLAYNNSLTVAFGKKNSVNDKEQSLPKNLTALVEKMSRAIETFLAFIPWDYTSCEKELQDSLPSLETDINDYALTLYGEELVSLDLKQQLVVYDVDVLCAVLGLRMEFGNFLKQIKSEWWFYQVETYHILNWLKNFKAMHQTNNVFYNMGFTEKKATSISNQIPLSLYNLQSPFYWAESYIESMFQCHPLLGDSKDFPNVSEHIDCPDTPENTPFEACVDVANPDQCDKGKFSIINGSDIDCLKVQSLIDDYISQLSLDGHTLFFHGTSHMSAASIFKWGINLTEGSERQDFSHKESFSLYYSYQNAKEWAKARNFDSAVVVFQIPDILLKETDNNGRDLTADNPENRQEWEEIVKYSRKGYTGNEPARFKSYSFIKGHLCANPNDVKKGSTPLKLSDTNLQFCLKKQNYAAVFGNTKHILCAVFYKNKCNCKGRRFCP